MADAAMGEAVVRDADQQLVRFRARLAEVWSRPPAAPEVVEEVGHVAVLGRGEIVARRAAAGSTAWAGVVLEDTLVDDQPRAPPRDFDAADVAMRVRGQGVRADRAALRKSAEAFAMEGCEPGVEEDQPDFA